MDRRWIEPRCDGLGLGRRSVEEGEVDKLGLQKVLVAFGLGDEQRQRRIIGENLGFANAGLGGEGLRGSTALSGGADQGGLEDLPQRNDGVDEFGFSLRILGLEPEGERWDVLGGVVGVLEAKFKAAFREG